MTETPRKRVLVVDDASLVRLYNRTALEAAGFQVDEALNGQEALEILLSRPADLVVVDINMPQMDGLTFVRTLRRQDLPLSATPAVMVSTEAKPQDFAAARTAGANFYLVKPVDRDALVECVAMLCGDAR